MSELTINNISGSGVLSYPKILFEKRKSKRINTLIVIDVAPTSYNISDKGCIVDISSGGMKLETNTDIGNVEYISISFTLPDGSLLNNVKGKILRKQKDNLTFTYGIQFIKIGLWDKYKIVRYINNQ